MRDSPDTHRASGRGGAAACMSGYQTVPRRDGDLPAVPWDLSTGARAGALCCPGRPQARGCPSLFAIKLVFCLNAVAVWANVARSEV